MSKQLRIIFTLIISIFSGSCARQELEDPFRYIAHIPITTDWSESLLKRSEIANVSICAYPVDGSQPINILSDNLLFNVLELPIGEYNILIHNELLGDIKGLANEHPDKYDEIRSHIIPVDNPKLLYDTLRMNDILVEHHNLISTWAMRHLVVNSEMVELTRSEEYKAYIEEANSRTKSRSDESVLSLTLPYVASASENNTEFKEATKTLENLSQVRPQCKNTVLHFNVRVNNLNNAMKIEALLRGTEYGAHLTSDRLECYEGICIVYEDIVRSRIYDDPNKGVHGYFDLKINTFCNGRSDRYYFDLSFALNDGRVLKFRIDITDHILAGGNSKYITINLGSTDDPAITLPPCREGGFNVDGWDDEIIVDIE